MHKLLQSTLVAFLIAIASVLVLTGCTGAGGNQAAPSGGAGAPVAVEIPSLDGVDTLPFTTGIVVTGSGSISAPVKSVSAAKTITGSGTTIDKGGSYVACETGNQWRHLLQASTQSDQGLCVLQDNVGTATAAGVTLDDGNDHIFNTTIVGEFGSVDMKFKTRITRNAANDVTGYVMKVCTAGKQSSYIQYTINGDDFSAVAKNLDGTELNAMMLVGELASDPTQYTSKTVSFEYVMDYHDPTDNGGAGTMIQSPHSMLMDSFDYRNGKGPRIYSSVDLTNPSTVPFDPHEYALGNGAGTAITPYFTVTECWDGSTLMPVTCLDSNPHYAAIKDKEPAKIYYPDIPFFAGDMAWDCSGTVEFTVPDPFTTGGADSCLARFTIHGGHVDCDKLETKFDLSAAVDGKTLSTKPESPTPISAAASIVLSLNRGGEPKTFDSSSVVLSNLSANLGVRLNLSNWNSDSTALTLAPFLVPGDSYRLTISGGNTGAMAGSGYNKIMDGQRVYYFTAE